MNIVKNCALGIVGGVALLYGTRKLYDVYLQHRKAYIIYYEVEGKTYFIYDGLSEKEIRYLFYFDYKSNVELVFHKCEIGTYRIDDRHIITVPWDSSGRRNNTIFSSNPCDFKFSLLEKKSFIDIIILIRTHKRGQESINKSLIANKFAKHDIEKRDNIELLTNSVWDADNRNAIKLDTDIITECKNILMAYMNSGFAEIGLLVGVQITRTNLNILENKHKKLYNDSIYHLKSYVDNLLELDTYLQIIEGTPCEKLLKNLYYGIDKPRRDNMHKFKMNDIFMKQANTVIDDYVKFCMIKFAKDGLSYDEIASYFELSS